jgi:hypothetical protein
MPCFKKVCTYCSSKVRALQSFEMYGKNNTASDYKRLIFQLLPGYIYKLSFKNYSKNLKIPQARLKKNELYNIHNKQKTYFESHPRIKNQTTQ